MTIIFFAALSFGYAILALVKPRQAVLILLGFSALWPPYVAIILRDWNFGLTPQRVFLLLTMVAWLLHYMNNQSIRKNLSKIISANRKVFYYAVLYFAVGIFTSGFSSALVSKSIAAGVNAFASYPMMLVFVISYFSTRKDIILLFYFIQLVAVSSEIIGFVEWINQGNLFALFINPVSSIAEEMMTDKIRDDVYRIQSTFSNPLSFAEFLLIVLPISLYFVSQRKCGALIRYLAVTQIIFGVVCIFLTASRTSIFLSVMMIAFSIVLQYWEKLSFTSRLFGAFSLIMLATLFFPWGNLIAFIVGGSDSIESTFARLYQLEVGIPAVLNSPVWGYGLGQGVIYVFPLESIDNYYLTAALETGLLGLIILLIFQVSALKLARQPNANSMFPSIGIFVAAAFIGVFVNELTLSIIDPFTFLFTILGALMVIQGNKNYPRYLVR